MIELDDARQEMLWRCLNYIGESGKVSKYNLGHFMTNQHKRWLGNYTTTHFIKVMESFGVVKSCYRLDTGITYQSIEITNKGLKFLEDCKLSPEIAWINLKGEKR